MNINLKNNLKVIPDKKSRSLLPNTLTIIGVCIGLSSIKFALDSRFDLSIIALTFSAIIDTLDGRVARLIKGTSQVGKELDSLTDVISFGVAPAFIMYFWSLSGLDKIGWLICLVYVVCVALRLARFNVNSNEQPSWRDNFFEGIPSPAGGILVLMPLIYDISGFSFFAISSNTVVPFLFVGISLLLISKVPTYSFKKISVQRKSTIFLLFGFVLFFALLLIYPFKVIVISGIIYLLSIPISYFHFRKLSKKENETTENSDEHEDVL